MDEMGQIQSESLDWLLRFFISISIRAPVVMNTRCHLDMRFDMLLPFSGILSRTYDSYMYADISCSSAGIPAHVFTFLRVWFQRYYVQAIYNGRAIPIGGANNPLLLPWSQFADIANRNGLTGFKWTKECSK